MDKSHILGVREQRNCAAVLVKKSHSHRGQQGRQDSVLTDKGYDSTVPKPEEQNMSGDSNQKHLNLNDESGLSSHQQVRICRVQKAWSYLQHSSGKDRGQGLELKMKLLSRVEGENMNEGHR